ncbi:saccharopine dehydrogenase NADP-binding domain-containing protein [Streptomyces sp. 549]|uniref:saccharopine dehydrogenase family protein n=1 Tax=Streptomyces sp. 549 TaxID=3049076 RepID=UPI0024C4036E|nr:saccharopine dehydrogenase NADP-binding domain-containing protein [Streptomyces sp. 549]MDK1472047.1 saccharopine dehydrogenase NADP-binding domain-containing protein [Streptomyces sp. 549]
MSRTHDLVLFGATGFTGRLTAEYLAAHAPADCRWALAGRSMEKLEDVRRRLAAIRPECAELPLLCVDASDGPALRRLAADTRVVATTVGPYRQYGGPLVAACAEEGTDYADLTGEPEFVDTVYLRHHERARQTGARLVHACGFDAVPHDLGVLYTVRHLPEGVPLRVDGHVRAQGTFSGGTLASALDAFSRGPQTARAAKARRRAEQQPEGRRLSSAPGPLRRVGVLRSWAVPLPTIDPRIVIRSAAALDRYGPDFHYRHAAAVRRLPVALAGSAAVAAVAALAQLPAARRALSGRLPAGQGPDAEQRARNWFWVRFIGEGGGRRVYTEVSGGDPGYGETAKMLAESALCLAFDDLPATAGQVTTAVAMGDALTARLQRAGVRFRLVRTEDQPASTQPPTT